MSEIILSWIPILAPCFAITLSVILIFLYWAQGHYEPGHLPTVSYSAMWFPGNQIMAVSLGLICVLVIVVFQCVSDHFRLYAHKLSRPILLVAVFCGLMFLITGSVNFGEVPNVHNVVAALAFLSLILLDLLMLIGEVQLGIGRGIVTQTCCVALSFLSIIGMLAATQVPQTALAWSLIGIFEYGVIGFAAFGLFFSYYLFGNIRITLVVEDTHLELANPLNQDGE
jgi:hypothetical protein